MKPTLKKQDLVADHPTFFKAAREPAFVKLPRAQYLTLEGKGAPGSPAFQAATGALYSLAYELKFAKKALGRDFTVAPLEGLWWFGSDQRALRSASRWKLLIMIPDFIELCDVAESKARLFTKRGDAAGPLGEAKLEKLAEGLCVQALHVGPYATEPKTIDLMKDAAAARHLAPKGPHHEIYLGDPGRTKPERLKTILRLPVARA